MLCFSLTTLVVRKNACRPKRIIICLFFTPKAPNAILTPQKKGVYIH